MVASLRLVVVAALVAAAVGVLRGGDELKVVPELEVVDQAVAMVEVEARSGVQQTAARHAGVRGDMTVQGSLKCTTLTSPIGDVKVTGGLAVTGSIKSGSTVGSFMKVDTATSVTNKIASKASELQVLGKIDADSITATGAVSTSFLEIDGVRQWQLVSLSDFEEEGAAEGWTHKDITECAGNKFLGGPCTNAGSSDVRKAFGDLPPHTQLRITAKYLFIDSWDGESAYMKIGDRVAWADSYNHASVTKGINVCGNETPEGRYMRSIDVTVPHTDSTFDLTFGATTDEHACDESFGVDSIMVFVR